LNRAAFPTPSTAPPSLNAPATCVISPLLVRTSETAGDVLRLTKLNCNTAAFNIRDPITLAFSKKVGEILKLAGDKEPAIHYRYYM
jgi:hypothetical protein